MQWPSSILVFGSQGPRSIIGAGTTAASREAVQHGAASTSSLAAAVATRALQGPLAADLSALELPVADVLAALAASAALPPALHHDAHCQALFTAYHQLIAVAAAIDASGRSFAAWVNDVSETVGFCSGLLPAAVLAAAASADDFVDYSIQALRACLWIAHHARPTASSSTTQPCSLVVGAVSRPQIDRLVQDASDHVSLSAILGTSAFAIAGPNLESLPPLPAGAVAQPSFIHGWYHRGAAGQSLPETVFQSLQARHITLAPLRRPLRLSHMGSVLAPGASPLEAILEHMLLLPIDFPRTAQELSAAVKDARAPVEIVTFGPALEPLASALRAQGIFDLDVSLHDLAPFNNTLPPRSTDIAIVGKSFQFPGADSDEALVEMLASKTCTVSEIPPSRFDVQQYQPSDEKSARTINTKFGCFLDEIAAFDYSYFSISPREARSMDPQQRLLLTSSKRALEDAGYVPNSTPSFKADSFGCYVGLATGDYTDNLQDDIDCYYSPGTLRAFHAGRISYCNKFSGPSMVTDTACSSSLVSIYQACRALAAGDCTSALAGGVNTISSPDMYIGLSTAHFLNDNGCCKPFDAGADGYCRGEASAIVVLKRLSDAIAEGDRIHGVIKGVGVNNSGNSHSITHPHSGTQSRLMKSVIEASGVDPAAINVVEAHGTGTQAGDAGEGNSLAQTLSSQGQKQPLSKTFVSSIKGNIGHTEAASGCAALIKLLVMLQNRTIYPQASFQTLNPKLIEPFAAANFAIPIQSEPWQQTNRSTPRTALLNNFGASGSNASLVLQEYSPSQSSNAALGAKMTPRSHFLFSLSATEPSRLATLVEACKKQISSSSGSQAGLADWCYSATARRQQHKHAIFLACDSLENLTGQLAAFKTGQEVAVPRPATPRHPLLLFSGQGGLYQGMGQDLLTSSAAYRQVVRVCDDVMLSLGMPSLLLYLDSSRAEEFAALELGHQLAVSHCACIALEYGLAQLLISWNLQPNLLIGHSLGEFAALATAGAISVQDAIRIAAVRGQAMGSLCKVNESGMLAVRASASTVQELLQTEQHAAEIACFNSADDVVVSGSLEQLARLSNVLRQQGVKCKLLDVPLGFHSAAIEPALPELRKVEQSVTFHKPQTRIFSTMLGRELALNDIATGDYFTRQARNPVQFLDTMQQSLGSLDKAELAIVEVGPRATLLALAKSICGPQPIYSCMLQCEKSAWQTLTLTVKSLAERGFSIDFRSFFQGTAARFHPLAEHPLVPKTENMFVQYKERQAASQAVQHTSPAVGKLLMSSVPPKTKEGSWLFTTSTHLLAPLISGHEVGEVAICPASVYHELCLEAVSCITGVGSTSQAGAITEAEDLQFSHPLIHRDGLPDDVVEIELQRDARFSEALVYFVTIRSGQGGVHFNATLTLRKTQQYAHRWKKQGLATTRLIRNLREKEETGDVCLFPSRILYENIFTRVVRYSKPYHALQRFAVSETSLEGAGRLKLPAESQGAGYALNPVFIDTLLHAAGFIANTIVASPADICICSHVGRIAFKADIDWSATHSVYTTLYEVESSSLLADAVALDASGNVVAEIEAMEFKKLRLASFKRFLGAGSIPAIETSQAPVKSMHVNMPIESPTSTFRAAELQQFTPPVSGTATPNVDVSHLVSDAAIAVSGMSRDALDFDSPLENMGVDSLMQIEFEAFLKKRLPQANIDRDDLFACTTLREVAARLEGLLGLQLSGSRRTSVVKEKTLRLLDEGKDTSLVPLILVHDGSGQSSLYQRLAGMQRPCWGISDPSFGKQQSDIGSVEEMAQGYIEQIRDANITAFIIAGWSFGGIVAYEIAQHSQGACQGLVLVDSPFPLDHQPLPRAVATAILEQNGNELPEQRKEQLVNNFGRCAQMLAAYKPSKQAAPVPKSTYLRSAETFDTQALAGVAYEWLSSQDYRTANIAQWTQLLGQDLLVEEIPGTHFEPFATSIVGQTRAALEKACKRADTH